MRVLLTTDYYWPHIGGGVQVVVQQVAERLAQRGHGVAVLTLNTRRALQEEWLNNVAVSRVPALELTRLLGMQFTAPLNPFKLRARLRSFQPHVVHAHNRFFTTSVFATLFRGRTPIVFTLHLGPVRMGRAVALYERLISRRLLRAADKVTAVSPLAAQVWPQARVIPNGVATELFRPAAEARQGFKVLCVGRLIRNKGPQRVLEAIPYMDPEIKVAFVGDGPLRSALQARARQLGVADRVAFEGEREDVHRLLPTGSLLVRPSDTEGMSLAVLEALACGLPVVASPAAAAGLIEHGVNGFSLTEMSPGEIGQYVNRLHKSPEEWRELSRNARCTAERFSWEKAVDAYEELYESMLRGKDG